MDVTVLFNQILYLWLETSHMFSKAKVERKRIHKDLWSVVSAPSDTIHEELYLCFIIWEELLFTKEQKQQRYSLPPRL